MSINSRLKSSHLIGAKASEIFPATPATAAAAAAAPSLLARATGLFKKNASLEKIHESSTALSDEGTGEEARIERATPLAKGASSASPVKRSVTFSPKSIVIEFPEEEAGSE